MDGGFVATLDDGATMHADMVLAAPGIRHFVNLPAWHAAVPPDRRGHTSDIVSFDGFAGARVVIIGGRQSAYEWAALLCEHGAERVDVVHRHAVPDFAKVSWAFVDGYLDSTLAQRGWWRRLPVARQQEISLAFWRVGRLTLEPWLPPRLAPDVVTAHPGTEVTGVAAGSADVTLTLSNGTALTADHVVFASGYRSDLAGVPYLAGVLDQVSVTDGFPDLTEGFETSLPGLYVTGFASTRDFGPFYGFTAGCPSAGPHRRRGDDRMSAAPDAGTRPRAGQRRPHPGGEVRRRARRRRPARPRRHRGRRSAGRLDPALPVDHVFLGNVVQAGSGQNPARAAGIAAASPARCRPRPSTTSASPR
jgi:hypothetical protein